MKAPSFAGFEPASEAASRAKRMNTRADTIHEKLLRSCLWQLGLRFRKNLKNLPGEPDIVFAGPHVVVFCDGDFWHGRNWRRLSSQLKKRANADYWRQKIRSNMIRDRRTTDLLTASGWYVIRLWEGDIRANPASAALLVEKVVLSRRTAPASVACAS